MGSTTATALPNLEEPEVLHNLYNDQISIIICLCYPSHTSVFELLAGRIYVHLSVLWAGGVVFFLVVRSLSARMPRMSRGDVDTGSSSGDKNSSCFIESVLFISF